MKEDLLKKRIEEIIRSKLVISNEPGVDYTTKSILDFIQENFIPKEPDTKSNQLIQTDVDN